MLFSSIIVLNCSKKDMRYGSRIEIISHILEIANGGSATKSKIVYNAFLSHSQLKATCFAMREIPTHLRLPKKALAYRSLQ